MLDQDVVKPADRRGHAARDIQGDLPVSRPSPLRFDEDDAVVGARTVNRRRRRVLQHLHRGDVVRVQEVEVRVLNGRSVDDVQRIVVLERADAADPHRGAGAGRPAVVDGHTGHAAIQPLQHARPRLPLETRRVHGRRRGREVAPQLLLVAGHDDVRQHRDRLLESRVHGRASVDAQRRAAVPDETERQDRVRRRRDRILPLGVGGRIDAAPADADGDALNGRPRDGGCHPAGHLRRLLGERRHPHQEHQRESHPHCTKKTRTLEHVVHGAILILRVFAWPGGPAS